jgi:hypothetical protein
MIILWARPRSRPGLFLVLVLSAGSVIGLGCAREEFVASEPAREATPTTTSEPTQPLSARLELQSSLAAGDHAAGTVVVSNNTGRPITTRGCGSPYAVALHDDSYTQQWPSLACAEVFTIPTGESRWPISIDATYSECPPTETNSCVANGAPPPLPPATYVATSHAPPELPVPAPADIAVTPRP